MKTRAITTILGATLLVAATAVRAQEELVTFADANLKQAVIEALSKLSPPIITTDPTPSQMLNLKQLAAPSRSICDLTGLEYATNLTGLNLDKNQIAGLGPLSGLTALTYLSLGDNYQIIDIGALSGLTSLTSLGMTNNQIVDISALAWLTKLQMLYLGHNQIVDIGALTRLTDLRTLYLDHNHISSISVLAGLTSLASVSLANNQISDISPLRELMSGWTGLFLNSNRISDLSPLSGLTNLQIIHLYDNQISDLNPLSGLINLQELWLQNNHISDISPLANLANASYLYLGGNPLADISPLTGLTHLTKLYLWKADLDWEAYCVDIPTIRDRNPGVDIGRDRNPYNCGYQPEPTPAGTEVAVTLTNRITGDVVVTLTFEEVTTAGTTTFTTSSEGPTPPTGFQLGDPPVYGEITTTASYSGWIDISVSYAGVRFPGPPEALRLFHSENGQWVDCTTVVYPDRQIICGAVTSLSPFAIMSDIMSPEIKSITATPNVLWPPDHKMVPITVTWTVTDNLDPAPAVRLRMITMNEGDETDTYDPSFDATTGDGHTIGDIEVDADGSIFLRAERAGTGAGRTYTLTYEATDFAGNSTTAAAIVTVPHQAP